MTSSCLFGHRAFFWIKLQSAAILTVSGKIQPKLGNALLNTPGETWVPMGCKKGKRGVK
jgi:hypothetical protein